MAGGRLGKGADADQWLARPSSEHGGRVFWMHAVTGERTWAQPLPQVVHVRDAMASSPGARGLKDDAVGTEFEQACWVCTQPFGSELVSSKTISGEVPHLEDVLRTMEQLGPEYACYPSPFPSKAGLDGIVFCARLRYDGQPRGHVPSFHSRVMYIDCTVQSRRRVVSSFHHELWHLADYALLGRSYEFADAEWCALNPPGFSYGKGGASMRAEDSTSGYLGSAQSDAFLNRYSTASAAEDKAEVWAAMLTDMVLVESSPELRRKRDMLKRRAEGLLGAMGSAELWEAIRLRQLAARRDEGEWERFTTEGGRAWWYNRATHEKRWEQPEAERPAKAPRTARPPSHAQRELAPARSADAAPEEAPTEASSQESLAKRPRRIGCGCFASCFPCLAGGPQPGSGDVELAEFPFDKARVRARAGRVAVRG